MSELDELDEFDLEEEVLELDEEVELETVSKKKSKKIENVSANKYCYYKREQKDLSSTI